MSACALSSVDFLAITLTSVAKSVRLLQSNAIVRSKCAVCGPAILARMLENADREERPMLNSARRHCASPRRWRLIEWSDQQRGNVRLYFRARLICRQRAFGASQESVGNAGSIDVTTTD
jgi:hypothetical protein